MSDRELTDMQKLALQSLFAEANGDVEEAMRIAGYASPERAKYAFVKTMRRELIDAAQIYLAMNGMKAARATVDAIDNPTEMGLNLKLQAASSILDRIGVSKTEQLNVETRAPVGIFILPPKDKDEC